MGRPLLKDKLLMLAFLTLGMMVLATGCTKKRDAGLPAADSTNSFVIAELVGPTFQVGTDSQSASPEVSAPNALKSANQKPNTKIKSANVPSRLGGLFSGRSIFGKQNANYQVIMSLNGTSLLVSKLVADKKELTEIELGLAKQSKKGIVAPLFMIPIKKIGILEREKNDLGEETAKLKFVDTDPESATHVQLDLRQTALKDPYANKENEKLLKEIFTADSLNNKVMNLDALRQSLDYKVVLSKPLDKVATRTKISANGINGSLLVYEITSKSKLDSVQAARLLQTLNNEDVIACDESILKQLSEEQRKDCVLVLDHTVAFTTGEIKQSESESGDLTSKLEFEPRKSGSGMIRVVAQTLANFNVPSSFNTIRISDIKGKEFFFRRTYEDSASTIQMFGPGSSGNMSLVTFDLEPKRLVVRKVLLVNGDKKPGSIDKEELMSMPVAYVRKAVGSSELVESSINDAEYILLNWKNNTVGVVNSPLSFLEAGQCFKENGNQTIVDPDIRLDKGVMSFSVEGTYTFIPECMSTYKLDQYWWANNTQVNFNIRERISFRVNSKELDNKIGFDIPFRAQNLLNFGVWTMGALNPDQYGNVGKHDTQKSLMMVHDFSGNKTMTYILGGLPEDDQELRKVMIDTTQKVIDDWNIALNKAFKGTSLDRNGGAYILLQIDGAHGTPIGNLGDLDKNYIWNYHKNIESNLLGMSQPAPNPRSGKIEQNNVLMYSGNLLSYIGGQKSNWEKQNELHQLREAILMAATKASPTLPQKAKAPSATSPATVKSVPPAVEKSPLLSKFLKLATPKSVSTSSNSEIVNTAMNLAKLQGETNHYAVTNSAKHGPNALLKKILDAVIKANAQKDPIALEAIVAMEIAKADSKVLSGLFKMSAQEQAMIRSQSKNLAMKASIHKNMNYNSDGSLRPNCAFDASTITSFPKNNMNRPVNEIFGEWYATTLSHEIGHSLGLTHNFKGSTDAKNFKFADEKESVRNYSSIMDYTPDIYAKYAGPGPYDVYALRAAYTGFLERKDGQFVHLSAIKNQLLGSRSWWDMDAQVAQSAGIKAMNYCTDIHVGYEPTCNRFDQGTSAGDIARFYAKEYQDNYILTNAMSDSMQGRSFSDYMMRMITSMLSLRQFVDEAFFLRFQNEAVDAGIVGWSALVNTVTTPDADGDEAPIFIYETDENNNTVKKLNPKRFSVAFYEYDEIVNGKATGKKIEDKVLIEKKSLQNISKPGFPWLYETRGFEINKAFASMLLAQRGIGHPRYASVGLAVSPSLLEAALGLPELGRPSLMAFRGMMEGQIPNVRMVTNGAQDWVKGKRLVHLNPLSYSSASSSLLEAYGALSAAVIGDIELSEDTFNFAAAFRVGNSKENPPKDRISIVAKDQSMTSEKSTKYWAFDNAPIAKDMIMSAAKARTYFDNYETLKKPLDEIMEARAEAKADNLKTAKENLIKALESLNQNNILLSKEDIKEGITFATLVEALVEFTERQVQMALAVSAELEKDKVLYEELIKNEPSIHESQREAVLNNILTEIAGKYGEMQSRQNEVLSRTQPIFALGEKLLAEKLAETELGLPSSGFLKSERLETRYSQTLESLKTLNSLVTTLHPELVR